MGPDGTVLERVHHGRPSYDETPGSYCHTCGQTFTGKECTRRDLHRRIEAFRRSDPPKYTAEQWSAMHAGTCGAGERPCGKPARLYAIGWRCDDHL